MQTTWRTKLVCHALGLPLWLTRSTGSESFWPLVCLLFERRSSLRDRAANDTPQEIEKCARILTTFTCERMACLYTRADVSAVKGVEETLHKETIDPTTGEIVAFEASSN
jgi:hypothetical protein